MVLLVVSWGIIETFLLILAHHPTDPFCHVNLAWAHIVEEALTKCILMWIKTKIVALYTVYVHILEFCGLWRSKKMPKISGYCKMFRKYDRKKRQL